MATTMHWLPTMPEASRTSAGFWTAAVLMETLSAPAFSRRRTSSTLRTPPPTVTTPPSPPLAAVSPGGAPLTIAAASPGDWGNSLTVRVDASSDGDASNFKLTVLNGATPVESFDSLTFQASPTLAPGATNPADYGRTVVNSRSEYIAITADFTARPSNGTIHLGNGSDGPPVTAAELIGAAAADSTVTGTGLHALDKITDVNLIAIPGQGDRIFSMTQDDELVRLLEEHREIRTALDRICKTVAQPGMNHVAVSIWGKEIEPWWDRETVPFAKVFYVCRVIVEQTLSQGCLIG